MATKLVEYTYDKSVGDCTPTLTPNTITMTKSDSTNGNIVTRTISVDSLPTKVNFQNNQALLTVTYFNISNLTDLGSTFKACKKLTTVEVSNQTAPNLTNMIHTFYDCYALTSVKLTNVNFTNSKGVQLVEMCRNCTSLTEFSVTGTIKVSDFRLTFYNCNKLTNISLTAFDVSSCRDFGNLFEICTKLETVDISNWDTRSATSFYAMFNSCKALTSLDLSHFNISNVTTIAHMFGSCEKLTSLNIQNWNTSKIEHFAGIFRGLKSMPNSFWDLSWMDVSSAKDISNIFADNIFTEIPNIYNWNTHNVNIWNYMFSKCINLTNVDLTFLDTSSLTSCSGLFSYCTNLTSFNINNWNTSNCGKLNEFVRDCVNLENLDGMKNIDITKVRDYGYFASNCTNLKDISLFENIKFPVETSLYDMLHYCTKVENWESLSTWDVSNVVNMAHLLNRTNITSLEPIRNWDVSSVRSMEGFLSGANDLSLEPIRNWDVSEVNNLNYFLDASQITDVSPIKNWETPKLESVASMFGTCYNLKKVELPNWITSKVTNMRSLFSRCRNLEYVDLSNWDSSKATMSGMFYECFKLKYIDLSSFDTGYSSPSFYQVFLSCTSLETLDLSNFRIINGLDTNGTFNGCSNLSKIALLYSTASDINTLMSKIKHLIAKEVKVYYYDADPTQLTPIDGVTYIKYEFPTTTSLPPHINLYSLSDGIKDELDVKTGILTRNVGEIAITGQNINWVSNGFETHDGYTSLTLVADWGSPNYNTLCRDYGLPLNLTTTNSLSVNATMSRTFNGGLNYWAVTEWGVGKIGVHIPIEIPTLDEAKQWLNENPIIIRYTTKTPTTEKLILNYNHSCDYGMVLPTGAMDYYNVVTSEYSQNISSILLDGADVWNEAVEKENTVRLLYVSPIDILMKASGGLYCDNDMFPNIQDDSDIEHCRVHDTDNNKLYIYIDKNRLMSPDLIGFQIWLQENQFTIYYETSETIISIKDYLELNPELARWDMMDVYNGGYLEITYNTETGIYPIVDYQVKSTNNFYIPTLENNTTYTVYANSTSENLDVYLGGSTYSLVSGKAYTSGDNNWLRFSAYRVSKNLYNKETATIGIYVDQWGGIIQSSSDVYSDYISIKPSTNYSYKIYSNVYHNASVAWYDSNKTFIKRDYVHSTNSTTTFESPSNASYVRVGNNNLLNIGFEGVGYALYEGDTCPDIFEDYKQRFYFDDINNMMVIKGDTTDEVVPYFTGILNVVNPAIKTPNKNLALVKKEAYSIDEVEITNIDGKINMSGSTTTSYATWDLTTGEKISSVKNYYVDKELCGQGTYTYKLVLDDIEEATYPTGNICSIHIQYDNDKSVEMQISEYEGKFRQYIYTGKIESSSKINGIYFKRWYIGSCDYISFTLQIEEGEVATDFVMAGGSTITPQITLRSSESGIKDSYNILTGEYIRRVSEDLQGLSIPIITTLEPKTLLAYENGKILLSSESGLLPTLTYSVPSTNTFRLPVIKTRTQYTLKYPSASGTITIGSLKYTINSDSMVFTTPLTINGDKSAIVFSDSNPQDVMLIEGNYSKREVPLFSGVKSVTNPKITVLNNTTGESVLYECTQDVDLRSLPNGVSDTLDIVNKKLTQVTGIRPFQNGDYELDNVWTDGNYTVYGLSSPIVSNVEFGTPVGYVNSTIYLASDYMIPVLNYRALSSNNFPLDLLLPNTTYTLYADTLVSGSYTLGGTHNGVFTGTEVINLGDTTNNLLTFNGDLGLSNVMLIKGNSINSTFPFFRGLKSVVNYKLKVEGMNGELNELIIDDGVGLRACGDLVDSVDLMTCTLTRNLTELTLNGSENWIDITPSENVDENYCLFAITVAGVKSSSNVKLACDKFNHYYQSGALHNKEGIYTVNNQIRLCVKKTTIGGDTVNNIKSWLQQNNTTVIYALQNSVIVPLENQWATMPPTSYMNQTTITSEVSDSLKPIITAVIAITSLEEIMANLEERNATLEEENIATMLALTSVYELMSTPSVATTETQVPTYGGMSVSPMGMVYARLVSKGFKTIDEVPYNLQAEVMYALRGME